MKKNWTKGYTPDYDLKNLNKSGLIDAKASYEEMLGRTPIRRKKRIGNRVVDDPNGPLLYPTGSGGYMDERTIRWKLQQIADLLEALPAFNLKRKKARKLLVVALTRAKCPNPWRLAHDFVRRGAVHCEWIDNSSLNWDEFVPPGKYYLEDPVVVQGYQIYGDEDGEVHIKRLRDGLEVVTEQL